MASQYGFNGAQIEKLVGDSGTYSNVVVRFTP
jgi:hypothetical protein